MKKIIVAAVAENRVIGKKGDIPWHYPEDMKHFRQLTSGNPVLMGRSTYNSLPDDYRPLPGRTNIVLTRSGIDDSHESVIEVNSLEEAWKEAGKRSEKVFIIGGESIYRQTLEQADRMVLTQVHSEPDGDTYFPEWNPGKWEEDSRDDREDISFVEYFRVQPSKE